jgi:hypothetical protein
MVSIVTNNYIIGIAGIIRILKGPYMNSGT